MISFIYGTVVDSTETSVIVEAGGIGYEIFMTGSAIEQAVRKEGQVKIHTHFHVREDAMQLFGFLSKDDLQMFRLLLGVNGVGPKAALAILSAGGPQSFTLAVMTGDEKALTVAQGVGKKLAQRIILELKDKIGGASPELDFSGPTPAVPAGENAVALATAALQELGYSSSEIAAALKGCDPKAGTEEMVRYALRSMVIRS